MMELTADGEDRGVIGIRYYECKLGTCMPSLWGLLGVSIIEIHGNGIIRRCIRISEGE